MDRSAYGLRALAARLRYYVDYHVNCAYLFAESRLVWIGWIGFLSFPLFYVIRAHIFPQPYDNLWLRLLGGLVFLPLIFVERWPERLEHIKPFYWYFLMIYAVPFFFSFMLFMNNANGISEAGLMATLFLALLVMDPIKVLITFVIGVSLGWGAYLLVGDGTFDALFLLPYLPAYLFVLATGSLVSLHSSRLDRERRHASYTVMSSIAHELRTPLLGIKSGASGLARYLPVLLDGYEQARRHGHDVGYIRPAHLNNLQQLLDDIERETDYSNSIIDMLLMNARKDIEREFEAFSMRHCVESALQRYPFSGAHERALVHWEGGEDFRLHGSELLMVHVLFNLLKNALYAVRKAGKGGVFINLQRQGNDCMLVVRDTGTGISRHELPLIFRDFYSGKPREEGAGMGLSFCRRVVESCHGHIEADSEEGSYTEFRLKFKEG